MWERSPCWETLRDHCVNMGGKVKPKLHWRSQDVGSARARGYLPGKPAYLERIVLQSENLEGYRHVSILTSDIELWDMEFPDQFQSHFGPAFPYSDIIHSFWNDNI